MDAGLVEQVRRFNRTVTQRVGALDDRFLARDRPLILQGPGAGAHITAGALLDDVLAIVRET